MSCEACEAIDAGRSGFCREHGRAFVSDDDRRQNPNMAALVDRLAEHHGITERHRCTGCGEFLSAIRVEMRIARCARCDRSRGRKGRL